MAFGVGDRVSCTSAGNAYIKNAKGRVLYVRTQTEILVEFDANIQGHDGMDACPVSGRADHCWFCNARHLTLIKPVKWETIVEVEVEGKLRK